MSGAIKPTKREVLEIVRGKLVASINEQIAELSRQEHAQDTDISGDVEKEILDKYKEDHAEDLRILDEVLGRLGMKESDEKASTQLDVRFHAPEPTSEVPRGIHRIEGHTQSHYYKPGWDQRVTLTIYGATSRLGLAFPTVDKQIEERAIAAKEIREKRARLQERARALLDNDSWRQLMLQMPAEATVHIDALRDMCGDVVDDVLVGKREWEE